MNYSESIYGYPRSFTLEGVQVTRTNVFLLPPGMSGGRFKQFRKRLRKIVLSGNLSAVIQKEGGAQ